MDLFYLGIVAFLFVATLGVLKLCDWLSSDHRGGHS